MGKAVKEKRYFEIRLPDSFLDLVPADHDSKRYRGDQAAYETCVPIIYGIGTYASKADALNRFLNRTENGKTNNGRLFYNRLIEHVDEYVKELTQKEFEIEQLHIKYGLLDWKGKFDEHALKRLATFGKKPELIKGVQMREEPYYDRKDAVPEVAYVLAKARAKSRNDTSLETYLADAENEAESLTDQALFDIFTKEVLNT